MYPSLEDILNALRHQNVADIRAFIGCVIYNAKLLKDIVTTLNPVYDILKKDARFKQVAVCEAAFNQIKLYITIDTVRVKYDPKFPLNLATDAQHGLPAVLSYIVNDTVKSIAFTSRSLSVSEKYYFYQSQLVKEVTAIYLACKKFYPFF